MTEERINATVGYIGAAYDVPSLVEKLLHQLASKQTIIVNVYDTTNQVAPINMYGTDVADTGLLHISHLYFGDPTKKHEMHCRFKHKSHPPWQAIAASVGVLVITLLLGYIFHAAINQIAKVENDYWEMMELEHRAEAADVAKSQEIAVKKFLDQDLTKESLEKFRSEFPQDEYSQKEIDEVRSEWADCVQDHLDV